MTVAFRTLHYLDGTSHEKWLKMCECDKREGYRGHICSNCKGAIPTQQEIDDYLRQMAINKEVEARNAKQTQS